MPRVIVAGYMVRYPLAGQVWAHLQYVLGLKQLGYDVFFFEDSGWHDSCYNPTRNRMGNGVSYGVRILRDAMQRFGLAEHWIYRDARHSYHGLSAREAREAIRQADLLINLSGVTWFDGFERIPGRIFVDEDPAFTQFRAASDDGYRALLNGHQRLYSYGHNVGQPMCTIPTTGMCWHAGCQPIVLDAWQSQFDACAERFTTVMSWNAYGSVAYEGEVYGQKSREFPKVIGLPQRVRRRFELAVSGEDVPTSDLLAHGWMITDPLCVSQTIDSYRDYIQRSRGEFSVAKQAYVRTRSGWFSDRSAAYLASGKPVVLQDTGYSQWLPTGEGLLSFSDLDQAAAAIEAVDGDYDRHCRSARSIAEAYFDARRVLGEMLAGL